MGLAVLSLSNLSSWLREKRLLKVCGTLFFFALVAEPVAANEIVRAGDVNVGFKGYGTLGLVSSDSDALGFRRDITQKHTAFDGDIEYRTDSLLGLQLEARYKSWLQLMLQAKAKYNYRGLDNSIDMALLQLRFSPEISLRMGRIPHDAYLLSDSRDVGFSYLWARPSVEFYGQLLLDHYEGMEVLYSKRIGRGSLDWRLGTGRFETHTYYAGPLQIKSKYEPLWQSNLQYQNGYWSVRLGVLRSELDDVHVDGRTEVIQGLGSLVAQIPLELIQAALHTNQTGDSVTQALGALAYESDRWLVQGELSHMKYTRSFFAGYLSAGYHFDVVTPYVKVARLYVRPRSLPASADQLSPEIDRQIGHLVNSIRTSASQTAYSVGLRWDVAPQIALKLQLDNRRVRDNHVYLWREAGGEQHDRSVNTLSVVADFVF